MPSGNESIHHIKEPLVGVKTGLMEMGASSDSYQAEIPNHSQEPNENDDVIDVKFAFDKAQQLYQVGRFKKVNILFRPLKIRLGTIL